MKYYIPTSSLNLENILQAESISPFSFYPIRKSGYKTIELISELKQFTNQIVLFNYPASFKINDKDRINFPILIEVEDETQLNDMIDYRDGMFFCSHTIHLTPTNSAFYFFSPDAYNLTLINARDNKSIKYYNKYRIFYSASSLPLKSLSIPNKIAVDIKEAKSDETKIDKQKGLIYSYLLGQLRNVTPELAKQIRLNQEIYNNLTSLISTPTHSVLKEKVKTLIEEYKKVDAIEQENARKFDIKFDEELSIFQLFKTPLCKFLEAFGLLDLLKERIAKKHDLRFLPNIESLNYDSLRALIEKHTIEAIKLHQSTLQLNFNDIVLADNKLSIKGYSFLNGVFGFIIDNELSQDQLLSDRRNFCSNVAKIVQEIINKQKGEDYWKESKEREYFTELFLHLYDSIKPFNIHKIENVELQSIAAFLLHGQSFDGLIKYLEEKEICNYALPLALYGALSGYMELNREHFTPILREEVVYAEVYKKLFGKEMQNMQIKIDPPQEGTDTVTSFNPQSKNPQVDNNGFTEKLIRDLDGKLGKKDPDIIKDLWKESSGNKGEFISLIDSSKLTKKGKNAINENLGINNPSIKSAKNTKNTKTSEQLELALDNQNCSNFVQEKTPMQTPENNEKYFVFDDNAWKKIEKFVPEKLRKELRKEYFDWLIEDLRKEDGKRKYYNGIDNKNNEIIIQKFCNQNDKKVPFSKELRQTLKTELLKIYGNR